MAENSGGPLHGLGILAHGSAIDEDLIRIDTAMVMLQGFPIRVILEKKEIAGEVAYAARLPDFELPAGVDWSARPKHIGRKRGESWSAASRGTTLTVHLIGQALKPGKGDLALGLVPLENQDGGIGLRMEIEVLSRLGQAPSCPC